MERFKILLSVATGVILILPLDNVEDKFTSMLPSGYMKLQGEIFYNPVMDPIVVPDFILESLSSNVDVFFIDGKWFVDKKM